MPARRNPGKQDTCQPFSFMKRHSWSRSRGWYHTVLVLGAVLQCQDSACAFAHPDLCYLRTPGEQIEEHAGEKTDADQ